MSPVQVLKRQCPQLTAGILLFLTLSTPAGVLYVDVNSAAPTSPYTNWDTAARDIQSAVDASAIGDTVLVTNGTYATGGRAVSGILTNRVAIDRAITVESVNGPEVTLIQGAYAPGATNGDGAIRCAYLTNGALLFGFTLTNGATRILGHPDRERSGGGLWCQNASAVVSNCVLAGDFAEMHGGGVYGGTLNNCTLIGNSANPQGGPQGAGGQGGGAYSATLNDCTLASNVAYNGGAAYYGTLINCTLTSNTASQNGGGVCNGSLNNCTLTSNWAGGNGGAAYYGTLNNCAIRANSANQYGGGAHCGSLNNCTVSDNRTRYYTGQGGGVSFAALSHTTLTSNTAWEGGGAYNCTLDDCILSANWVFPSDMGWGGGACSSTLHNCILTGNSGGVGGGAYGGTLNNCTLTGNSAPWGGEAGGGKGGGAASATLNNCIVYSNIAGWVGANNTSSNYHSCTLNYCCSGLVPSGGAGNITNAPAFVDCAGGNLRLQTNSPCINAGNNAYALGSTDLDGRPRIVSGTVDIGAYEFQLGVSGTFLGWLQRYGLPTDGSADYADCDRDGMNCWLEFCTGTDPTNSLSVLRLVSVARDASGLSVTWQSVSKQTYFLERGTALGGHTSFLTVATNITGGAGTTTYTDTNAVGAGPFFYRVGVQAAGWQLPSGGSIISYAWLQQYGLPTDGSADYADPDQDGLNNWQEWRAGTDPTNAGSTLRMLSATGAVSGVIVAWSSVSGRSYSLERATSLGTPPAFALLRSNIPGQAGATSFTDTNALAAAPRFYRVRVEQ